MDLTDEGGFPSPILVSGNRVMPFWSSKRRVQSIIKNVNTYSLFKPYEISYQDFIGRWLPGLKNDHFLVGINWTGYDLEQEEVLKYLNDLIF